MLQLINIKKAYFTSTEVVPALRGISLSFRKNEFVSILGPSGCGKTTLLNIIGGLDKYSVGELRICGRPTSDFTDRDWDVYRNHRIGFIFQSYNLIPHQTILQNVELALTIAGIGKEERTERAKRTLDRVGLAGMYRKRPNQLSGGQCQRVAIARALVNDPEILLADEPTGALDTKTSGQIMDLIKEIAGERLVIMVTHNPDLAEQYSTRIIRLLDGRVTEDTNPYSPEEENAEYPQTAEEIVAERHRAASGSKNGKIAKEKAKMSIFTAFRLSARNLISKRRRTCLVGFAGSIGIIGIAMVLAISAGIKGYVASMQDDMLSGNPIRIQESAYDTDALTDMMNDRTAKAIRDKTLRRLYVNSLVEYLAEMSKKSENLMVKNEISEDYLAYVRSMPEENYAAIVSNYGADLSLNLYTGFRVDAAAEEQMLSITALTSLYKDALQKTEFGQYFSMLGGVLHQMPDNEEYILSQYDVAGGRMAESANEAMLVLDKDSALTDVALARLGFYSLADFENIVARATEDEDYDESMYREYFSYDEILGKTLTFYPNDAVYQSVEGAGGSGPMKVAPFRYLPDAKEATGEGMPVTIVGLLIPKEEISFGCLQSGFYYTAAFADAAREANLHSAIVSYLNENELTGFSQMVTGKVGYGFTYLHNGETRNVSDTLPSFNPITAMMSGMGGITDELSLADLGGAENPTSVTIYPQSFESKDRVTEWLDAWNDGEIAITVGDKTIAADERFSVKYTDALAIIISVINTLIDVVSTALIAFTSVSLVVSTVMIGILTYVSVVERTKEIGVIRSLGGRKKDVRHLFNAETFIIGFLAGLFGIGITALLSLLLNFLVATLAGVHVTAYLPLSDAVILLALSTVLTLISGLIPASAAARRDPVVALRSE